MPRRGMTVHWNGPAARVVGHRNGHRRCKAYWRILDSFHARTYPGGQIPGTLYSFGACPHGERFVAQGWDKPQGANGSPVKDKTLGPDRDWYTVIAFIGIGEAPTPEMVQCIRDLIAEARDTGRAGLEVKPHLDFKYKACPGPDLTALCREWDHTPFDFQEDTMASLKIVAGHDGDGRWWRFTEGGDFGIECAEADARAAVDLTGGRILGHPEIHWLKRVNGLVNLAGEIER